VKKLLTPTDPQSTLQASYGGKVSQASVSDPVKDSCLCTGYLIMLYRESNADISLDGLDGAKFTIVDNELKYDGQTVQNSYVVFRYSFDEVRGLDRDSSWLETFSAASAALDDLITAADDKEREKIFNTALSLYKQGHKLLQQDPNYTVKEAEAISGDQLAQLLKKYQKPLPPAEPLRKVFPETVLPPSLSEVTAADVAAASEEYRAVLRQNNLL
jgi:hypothetical protein